ncbi:MAG: TrkA C-terminal domain-containing protein [Nitrospiria bacterium]
MVNFLKIELLPWYGGFKELIYTLADKLDYRMKELKISLTGNMIEKELDQGFVRLGKKALSYYQKNSGLQELDSAHFRQELERIQDLKNRYSQTLQELSDLQRKALKEALSECATQFNRTGWEFLQIPIPEKSKYAQKQIKELPPTRDILILMVKRENRMELVHGNTILEGGEALICIGTEKGLSDFKNLIRQIEVTI